MTINRLFIPILLLGFQVVTAAEPAALGIQDLRERAPTTVQAGRLVMQGQVVHRAIGGAWIKVNLQSVWGAVTCRITRIDSVPGVLPLVPGTPRLRREHWRGARWHGKKSGRAVRGFGWRETSPMLIQAGRSGRDDLPLMTKLCGSKSRWWSTVGAAPSLLRPIEIFRMGRMPVTSSTSIWPSPPARRRWPSISTAERG